MSLPIFKARLKAKIKTLGVNNLSNERIDAYAATLHKKNPDLKDDDETGHDAKIDDLNEFVDFKKVATEDDRVRNLEAQLKKTPPATSKETEEEDEEEEVQNNSGSNQETKKKKERVPSYVKAIMEKLEKLENEKKATSIQDKISSHPKMKDIPKEFYEDYVHPEKEEDVDAFADKVSGKYSTFKQVTKNEKATSLTKPVSADTRTDKVDEKEVEALIDDLMPGTKQKATA